MNFADVEMFRSMRSRLMSAYKRGRIAVLDIGSSKITCMVLRIDQARMAEAEAQGLRGTALLGAVEVAGARTVQSRGIRRGEIVDMEEVCRAIRLALLNAEKLNVELTDKTYTLESSDSDIRVKLTHLEQKYNEVTASEQELAWKCESLTKKLEDMPSEAESTRQLQMMEKEKADLKETVNKLSVKLYKVVGFLDEMVQEQDQIINASKSGDSDKLLSNVSGMKSQITTVIDSVIENMPAVSHPDEENDS